jgi:formyl-CoA transferase
MIVDVEYPGRGIYQTVGCPVKLSASPARVTRPPQLGEHSEAVLQELCEVSPEELQRLRQAGVI